MDVDNIVNQILLKNDYELNINTKRNILEKYTINKYFPLINESEKNFVRKCYYYLLDYIYQTMFKNKDEFWEQIESNNYQDIETIFLLLLPFLKDNNTKQISRLNQLYYKSDNLNKKHFDKTELRDLANKLKYTNTIINLLNNDDNEKNITIDYRKMMIVHLELTLMTIRRTSNKLMINWNNIWPKDFIEWRNFRIPNDENLVLETIKTLNNMATFSEDKYNELIKYPKGIWIGDIYDSIVNRFYKSVLPCKFLIYSKKDELGRISYGLYECIDMLQNMLDINELDLSKKFTDLPENKQNKLLNIFKNNNTRDYIKTDFGIYIYKFVVKYCTIYYEVKGERHNSVSEAEELLGDEDDKIDMAALNSSLELENTISGDLFYNVIIDSITKLKCTPYYRFLIKNDNDILKINEEFRNGNNLISEDSYEYCTLKFVYNWAKALCHTGRNFSLNSNYFISKPKENIDILKRLSNDTATWFNITNNLLLFNDTNDNGIPVNIHRDMIRNVEIEINSIIYDIPFYLVLIMDDMLRSGVLSEYKVNTKLTNKKINNETRDKILKDIFNTNNEKWKKCNYYWTNESYDKLIKFKTDAKYKNEHYFELLQKSKIFKWSTFFSNDWVTQIDFYTHFLNQQIMYVTGATGQGKSTQVPKLTAYGVKTFLYRYNGKVTGTQPRIGPTVGNINWISKELGIPIRNYEKINNKDEEIITNNYYLEYKYKGNDHMLPNNTLKLKMVTDGSLLTEIANGLILKTKYKTKNTQYSHTNLYDVIMIDEAHEHNANMDIILSIMKQCLYYNNNIRLLIISATMDDDEPIYRSYYSLLNDNLTYPYRNVSCFFNTFIDANYYDRRFHISPPGGTTQHKVEDIYSPVNVPLDDKKTASKIVQEESYKLVNEIASRNAQGEILMFLNGQREIIEAVNHLNEILPRKTIALPYYTRMNKKYKDIVANIEKHITKLRVKKSDVANNWGEDYIEDNSVPNNLYDRAVIIATNVAEASITINRLKFVVDNGYAKELVFDNVTGSSLVVDEISESSRVQRRGRVGRKQNGKAYFLYEKGAREKNPPKLGITQKDPISWMDPLLKSKQNKSEVLTPIMEENTDYNISKDNINNIFKKSNKSYYNLGYILRSNELNLINENFYQKNKTPPSYYYKTYDDFFAKEMLLDLKGDYWIIHPSEKNLKRNIFYKIIKFNDKDEKEIPKYYQEYLDNYIEINKNYMIGSGQVVISTLSNLISELENSLDITNFEASSVMYGLAFNIIPEVLLCISILNVINNDISKLLTKNEIKNLQSLNKYRSDMDIIINIVNKALKITKHNFLRNFNKYSYLLKKDLIYEVNKLKYLYKTNPDKLDIIDLNLLKRITAKGQNNGNELILRESKYINDYLKKSFIKLNLDLNEKIADEVNIKFNDLLVKMITLNADKDVNEYDIFEDKKYSILKELVKFEELCVDKNELILFCLLSGKEENLVFSDSNKNNNYVDKYTRKYTINTIGYKRIPLKVIQNNKLCHYYSSILNDNINIMNILTNIKIEWLLLLNPKYMLREFSDISTLQNDVMYNNNIIKRTKITNNNDFAYLRDKVRGKKCLIYKYWGSDTLEIYNSINMKQKSLNNLLI